MQFDRDVKLKFNPRPATNTILCVRESASNPKLESIIYEQSGTKPYFPALTHDQQVDWNMACHALGWPQIPHTPERTQS